MRRVLLAGLSAFCGGNHLSANSNAKVPPEQRQHPQAVESRQEKVQNCHMHKIGAHLQHSTAVKDTGSGTQLLESKSLSSCDILARRLLLQCLEDVVNTKNANTYSDHRTTLAL